MKLKIISASKKIFEGEVVQILVPGGKGEMVILPMHAGMISTLSVGYIKVTHDDTESEILINGGFVQVENDEIVILVEEAVMTHDLVEEEIEEAITRAEEKKMQSDASLSELIQIEKQLQFEKLKKQAITRTKS